MALVTGGAKVIGEAISKRFAEEGAAVVVADIECKVLTKQLMPLSLLAARPLP